jgi:hypothetical protein
MTGNDSVEGEDVHILEIPDPILEDHEIDEGLGFREFVVPAALANSYPILARRSMASLATICCPPRGESVRRIRPDIRNSETTPAAEGGPRLESRPRVAGRSSA